jgi:2-phospho-L-lactate guanylyltransferase
MSLWTLIPVSPLEEGKSRLAEALTPAERYLLNQTFFRQTLETAAVVSERSRILVVSRSGALLGAAGALGFQTLLESSPHGLNQALTQAAEFACARGASALLSLSCDLPFLIPDELRALLDAAARGDGLAIASDRAGSGTNAMVIASARRIAYCYGLDSFAAHRRAAAAIGLKMDVVRRAGLSFDIDTPDDFEQMEDIMREALPVTLAASGGRLKRTMLEGSIIDAA